jgi:DNA-directed RNA polymerase subunit RPC12/RpoP
VSTPIKGRALGFIRPGCETRRQAADLIAELLPPLGVTSSARACPHCDYPILYIHVGVPYEEAGTNGWIVYECVRCGATRTLADGQAHAELEAR